MLVQLKYYIFDDQLDRQIKYNFSEFCFYEAMDFLRGDKNINL